MDQCGRSLPGGAVKAPACSGIPEDSPAPSHCIFHHHGSFRKGCSITAPRARGGPSGWQGLALGNPCSCPDSLNFFLRFPGPSTFGHSPS